MLFQDLYDIPFQGVVDIELIHIFLSDLPTRKNFYNKVIDHSRVDHFNGFELFRLIDIFVIIMYP
jgi:hypothetical protein